jgi:hypothetical protein
VADDETRHAELAWRFVGWALDQAPRSVGQVLRSELDRAAPGQDAFTEPLAAEDAELLAHGVVPQGLRRELQNAAFRQVIAPCGAALLARAVRQGAEKPVLSA